MGGKVGGHDVKRKIVAVNLIEAVEYQTDRSNCTQRLKL